MCDIRKTNSPNGSLYRNMIYLTHKHKNLKILALTDFSYISTFDPRLTLDQARLVARVEPESRIGTRNSL